jgi:hypothetical protein
LGSLPDLERFNMGTLNVTNTSERWVMIYQEPGESSEVEIDRGDSAWLHRNSDLVDVSQHRGG